jgi:hypothetical protein
MENLDLSCLLSWSLDFHVRSRLFLCLRRRFHTIFITRLHTSVLTYPVLVICGCLFFFQSIIPVIHTAMPNSRNETCDQKNDDDDDDGYRTSSLVPVGFIASR